MPVLPKGVGTSELVTPNRVKPISELLGYLRDDLRQQVHEPNENELKGYEIKKILR